ncbi:T-lymphoma invasion and metastasis-inducing protein 1-like isoform X1 [Simochromis diagramma]|uniref:T-lymphoma invasion and metastasis-inducing protein 1-like isoform X1 n=1 Tax=Simochromis diagramma TaxID=43689 RepID=UPI001A7E9506|nr:T-lymphoma invasion and metastasis-inducing protein 1-like isoform X1 [Simochromis diagramma]XP_039889135.1 T-lymphoma invasion and metastasis-inducing protein 1-like isoform X1 [Simochromis diagramma]XP_039889136.1 T-lymphoma invasion and metastasis-inducing protein 1-like isoform X1 [Simochromis diagramma]
MGNVESQNGESSIHGDVPRHLSRKHTTRSLRISNKQQINRRSRHSSSVKQNHRNSEASTRSSSTPSIPQSLVENGLEFFNAADEFDKFGINPHWTQRVAMTMRPESYQHDDDPLATPTPETSEADTIAQDGGEDSTGEGDTIGEERFLQQMTEGPREGASNKKKRSKSADMWREDSLEFSMSDLSQEHLTSTEEMVDGGEEEEGQFRCPRGSKGSTGSTERASSLDHLCSQQSPGFRGQRSRYIKNCREAECDGDGEVEEGLMSPAEDDGGGYGAFTLPCRRSHCLSEGLTGLGIPATPCPTFQGRRAQTTQDISGVLGEGSEYGDSGIDGVAPEIDGEGELLSRRCKAMSASFSVYSATESSFFNGSDSGSSSAGGVDGRGGEGGKGGVYENFRKELDNQAWTNRGRDCTEEAGSAVSDEQSSGTLSSMYPPDTLISCAHGTVRKAGTLAVKNFLVHKKNKKVEPAARRKWKQYWVSLKGCTLFLYEYDGRSGIDHNSVHKHALWVENSIVQAVPEHPKKDFVFCLSNSVGDAFLFQTSGQTELENWITAIHSACATALARQHHREDTVRLLRTEIRKLEQKIDMDEKMKKMGDMQLSTVTDGKKRKTILEQIFLWEQNLERFHIDLFRCRCYLASLQGGEPPNPKRLLGFASRPTKVAMGRLGIFSVSSFHALVSARTESSMRRRNQPFPRTFSKRRSRFSSLWGLDTASRRKSKGHPSIDQVFADGAEPVRKSLQKVFEDSSSEKSKEREASVKSLPQQNVDSDIWVPEYLKPSWVCLPNNQPILAVIQPGETTLEVLNTVCKTHKIDPSGHYLRLKVLVDNQILYYVPTFEEDISDLLYKEIEIYPKSTKVVQFDKAEFCNNGYGFSVAVLEEDGVQQLQVTEVKAGGMASAKGLKAGDEILLLNGKEASALQKDDMMSAFTNQTLTLSISTLPQLDPRMVCSCPPRRSDVEQNLATDIFSQSQEDILDDVSGLPLESPDDTYEEEPCLPLQSHRDHQEDKTCIGTGYKSTEQVTVFCRGLHDINPPECPMSSSSSSSSSSLSPSPVSVLPPTAAAATQKQLSHADKLRKVINELVETEKTYVKDLNCLIERYLKPLQEKSFLTQDELDVLFGNLGEMVEFQVEFLRTLEDGIRLMPDQERLERVEQFKKVLFSLGGSFLYYADRFKIYSAFCASHTKVPKVLAKAKTDPEFKAFLAEKNPRQQHSSTLESYLIKPIQRVLKYPLLLRELYSLTDPDSEEHYHLDVAIKAMNKVASHINEMQKLHEEYGAVFDQLINEQTADKKEVADLSMGDLLLHSTVAWINPQTSLAKSKKDPDLAAFVFKTAVVFVYKDCSKHRKKIGASHRGSGGDEKDPIRFRHMIATDSLQVRTLPNSEATADCEIVHTRSESEGRPERSFQLCFSSPESKKDFLKAVHSILREKQRRQLLKTECLPPSQQYVPFGGKRLSALKGVRPTMNRAASAPSRTLARRRLVRNRITIDTDLVFHGDNNNSTHEDPSSRSSRPCSKSDLSDQLQPCKPQGEDTDRWVEEQFNLGCYENQCEGTDVGQVKETDILSDDDEYCTSVRAMSTKLDNLEEQMKGLNLQVKDINLNGGAECEITQEEDADRTKHGDDSSLVDSITSCGASLPSSATSTLKVASLKQCAVEGATNQDHDVIWVRRDDFANSDVF